MNGSYHLGRVWGIPIGLHWSLLLVFALLTTSLAAGYFPDGYPDLAAPVHWLLAAFTAVLFFGSILLHELGHAYAARRQGLPVRGITLFIFGGVAEMEEGPRTPGAEFRVAIAGPLVSFALVLLFGVLWLIDRGSDLLGAPSLWLMNVNLALALFNLIPGFPLDGGRVLRAAVWRATGSLPRATRVAAVTGQLAAFGLMAWGALTILNGSFVNGIWLIFIGWFLQNAAVAEGAGVVADDLLRGATVAQAMGPTEPFVPSRLKLRQLADEHLLATGQTHFLVVDGDVPRGLLTLRDLVAVPRDRWQWTAVGDVMTPWAALPRVEPATDLRAALRTMLEAKTRHLTVADGDRPLGLLTREEAIGYARLRAQVGA